MAVTHLRQGEIEDLLRYIMLNEKMNDGTLAEISDSIDITVDIGVYETISSFGTNPKEITKNSIGHFMECDGCLAEYRSSVLKNALSTANSDYRLSGKLKWAKNYFELVNRKIAEFDHFGIYYSARNH